MDHETALAESGKLVAPSRHHDIPGPSSHDDDKSNDMARRGGRQFAMQTGCRRDAGHGSPFPLPLPYLYSFTCILNCTKKQGPFFFIFSRSKQHACIFMGYECAAATNQATTQRSLGYSGHRERDWGRSMAGGKGSQKRCATGSSKDGCFYFPFHSRQGFSGCLVGALGAATKTHKGTANRGVPYCGRSKQANPEAWVFYSDHTDSVGSRTRSGKGSKQQAEGMWALVWLREPVVVAWCWGRNGGHIVLLYMGYGSMRGGSIQQFP